MVSHEDLLVTMTVLISIAVIIETALIIWGAREGGLTGSADTQLGMRFSSAISSFQTIRNACILAGVIIPIFTGPRPIDIAGTFDVPRAGEVRQEA